jgi:nitroreductase
MQNRITMIRSKIIPNWIKYTIKGIPSFWYDFIRFYKHSAYRNTEGKNHLIAKIIHDYHIIEKGLTMPETRMGFGKHKIIDLINECTQFISKYGEDNQQVEHALKVINEYKEFHVKSNYKLDYEVENSIKHLISITNNTKCTMQRVIKKEEYFSRVEDDFSAFSNSRASVRNYSLEELDINHIINSVSLARNTPSACNRQTSKVYIYTNKKDIEAVLQVQGGNRGFGHLTNKLIVITADVSVFFGINERYQAYIDGGMFAMNLLYSLHYNKIAACILNCSNTNKKDLMMRKVCDIKDNEVFIAMISCGKSPDQFKIALSHRNLIDDYVTVK